MLDTIQEDWEVIPEFTDYLISNLGRIAHQRRDVIMRSSFTPFGHLKITLKADVDGERYTRSVAQLVAEAFVEPPNELCERIVVLNGDFANVAAYNLAWRPHGFAWEYTRQLKIAQPLHYKNLQVVNVVTSVVYDSIVTAGIVEGCLFKDIWRSTYTGAAIFPYGSIFEIVK